MLSVTRRDFLRSALVAGAAAAVPARAAKRSATDLVTLGKSNVQVTRLAFGTGTHGGRVQRELGQEGFNKLVRYAYERGIRFFETAESYSGMPQMLAAALKGIPRDSYRLMSKIRYRDESEDITPRLDALRRNMNTEYLDILLLHCVRSASWPEECKRMRDTYSEAKVKKVILSHGASVHGLPPLRQFPGNAWLDVALMRVNHDGTMMDNMAGDARTKGDVKEVTGHVQSVHSQGTGVIGMKIMGEGRFITPEDREASIQYVMKLGTVDAVTIGYKNAAEIDEAIERINRAVSA